MQSNAEKRQKNIFLVSFPISSLMYAISKDSRCNEREEKISFSFSNVNLFGFSENWSTLVEISSSDEDSMRDSTWVYVVRLRSFSVYIYIYIYIYVYIHIYIWRRDARKLFKVGKPCLRDKVIRSRESASPRDAEWRGIKRRPTREAADVEVMSIATGELADWPKAPGVSVDHTARGYPTFAVASSFWISPFSCGAENRWRAEKRHGTGEYRAATVGSRLSTMVAMRLFS